MPDDVPAQVVAYPVGRPYGASQQVLHPVRRAVPGDLRQLPPVLALDRTHQRPEVLHGPLARIPTGKVRAEAFADLLQPMRPGLHLLRTHPGRFHHHHDPSSRARTDHPLTGSTTVVLGWDADFSLASRVTQLVARGAPR